MSHRNSKMVSISLDEHIFDKINEKKGGLTVSSYIRETLFIRWEKEKIRRNT